GAAPRGSEHRVDRAADDRGSTAAGGSSPDSGSSRAGQRASKDPPSASRSRGLPTRPRPCPRAGTEPGLGACPPCALLTPSGWQPPNCGLGENQICTSRPPDAMTNLTTVPSPGELMSSPILRPTEAPSPEAEASTALIAVVITVVFLTLLSVVVLIFFYLYKNKGSYVTYEPAEGEPGAVLQMESNSAKGKEKEEYFI
uniref:Small cell adhesion glycoprotein n=2 Tax=Sus scrofa TaxID=9823 RepID=A0A8D0MXY6_PIG